MPRIEPSIGQSRSANRTMPVSWQRFLYQEVSAWPTGLVLQTASAMGKAHSRKTEREDTPKTGTSLSEPAQVLSFSGRPDDVIEARFVAPASMFIQFADGVSGVWSFRRFQLDMTDMKLPTIRAAASGTSVEVRGKGGDKVELDASALRCMIDPAYAAELKRAFLAIIGPLDKLHTVPQR